MKPELSFDKIYRCTLEVRGYELDSFGHVNHSVYINYLEFARWKMLNEENITLETFNTWQRWPVIAQIEVSYLKPAFMGETLEITTQVLEKGKTNHTFLQEIRRANFPILRAKIRSVLVNEAGRPAELTGALATLGMKTSHE